MTGAILARARARARRRKPPPPWVLIALAVVLVLAAFGIYFALHLVNGADGSNFRRVVDVALVVFDVTAIRRYWHWFIAEWERWRDDD